MEAYYTIELYDETVKDALDTLTENSGSFKDALEMLMTRFQYAEWAADMIIHDYLERYV